LIRLLNHFDEAYAVLMLVVERHYLKTYAGGFTENFYGLKRERVLRVKNGEVPRANIGAASLVRDTLSLSNYDIWKNLAVMVGVPYLKSKLDEGYDIHTPQSSLLGPSYNRDTLPPNPTIKQRLMFYYKWFLRNIYPSVNAAYYFSLLAFNLAYLFDGSKYHSPFLFLIGTRMRRLGEADYRAIAAAAEPKPSTDTGSLPTSTLSMFHPRNIYPTAMSSLRLFLPTSIFLLKFLEWWYASDFARQLSRKATEGLELPPPLISGLPPKLAKRKSPSGSPTPKSAIKSYSSEPQTPSGPPLATPSLLPILTVPAPTSETSALCPICRTNITTPTACQTGFVFCYTCIHRWVEGMHDMQEDFMGGGLPEGVDVDAIMQMEEGWEKSVKREGKWESGKGRCAVTGRRVLGGTEGLRRVMV
jgi:peroxin-12